MRDVVTSFYKGTPAKLIASGEIGVTDRVLVICAGELDRAVMSGLGFTDVTVTGLNGDDHRQDAESLPSARPEPLEGPSRCAPPRSRRALSE